MQTRRQLAHEEIDRMWRSKAKAADEPRKDSTISSAIENSSVAAKDCEVK
jgi:hypothetical protein